METPIPMLKTAVAAHHKTSLVVIVACSVLHNMTRLRGEPVPDDDGCQPPEVVPVARVYRNEGGQALRNFIIGHFE